MFKKYFKFIIIIIAILVIVILVLILLFQNNSNSINNQNTTTEKTNNSEILSSKELYIPAYNSSSNIKTDNFYQSSKSISGDLITLQDSKQFSISYNAKTDFFTIILLPNPDFSNFAIVQNQAEDTFLKQLNISQVDACKLYVSESVPSSLTTVLDENGEQVSTIDNPEKYSNIPLSFCG